MEVFVLVVNGEVKEVCRHFARVTSYGEQYAEHNDGWFSQTGIGVWEMKRDHGMRVSAEIKIYRRLLDTES